MDSISPYNLRIEQGAERKNAAAMESKGIKKTTTTAEPTFNINAFTIKAIALLWNKIYHSF